MHNRKLKNTFIWFFCISFFLCGIFSISSPIYADIYIYIDSEGVIHFTNTPTSSDYKLYIREQPYRSVRAHSEERFDHLIAEASKRHGVDFPLLKALIKAESDFNPRAVSRTGAKGLMQIMPANIKALRIKNPFDPAENIMSGARYLKRLLVQFDNKLPLALAAYNAGPNAVKRYKSIPPYRETEDFVQKVMKYYYLLKKG